MKYFIFLFICGVYKVKITSNLTFQKIYFVLGIILHKLKRKKFYYNLIYKK